MSIVADWNHRLDNVRDHWNRIITGPDTVWSRKIDNIRVSWNVWHYQIGGQSPTTFTKAKRYGCWESRIRLINSNWERKAGRSEWTERIDRIRKSWKDMGKQIKGGIVVIAGADIKNERIGMVQLRDMLNKQGFRCALTGRELTPENCSIDHIIPLCKGGTHTLDNAQLVVSDANKSKGMLTEEEFICLCTDVVNHASTKK